jgi:nitric oxide reductase subunit B
LLFWLRMPGDTLVILGTVLFGWDVAAKLRHQRETSEEVVRQPVADRTLVESDD